MAHGKPAGERQLVHRRALHLVTTPRRARRPGIDRGEVMPGLEQGGKAGDGEVRRAHEAQPEPAHPSKNPLSRTERVNLIGGQSLWIGCMTDHRASTGSA